MALLALLLRRAQTAEDVEPAEPGEREVEHDERRRRGDDRLHGGEAVVDGEHLEPVGFERPGHGGAHALVVIDDHDTARGGHGAKLVVDPKLRNR